MLVLKHPFASLVVVCEALALAAQAIEGETQPLITPAPKVPEFLEKRDVVTWAYVSGDSNSPLTCPNAFTTTQEVSGYGIQSCCNSLSCVGVYHTCIAYGVTTCTDGLPCSDLYTSYLSCGAQSPKCVTYRSITGPADPGGLSSYDCGPSATELLALGSPAAVAAVSTLASTAPVDGVGFGPSGVATTIVASVNTIPSQPPSPTSGVQTSSSLNTNLSATSQASTEVGSLPSTSTGLSNPSPTNNNPASATGSGSGSGNGNNSSGGLTTGDIVGIVAGAASVIAIFVAIYLKWPKTITRCLTCGICTTIDDDNQPAYHGVPLRYIPQHYDAPGYQPYNQSYNNNYIR